MPTLFAFMALAIVRFVHRLDPYLVRIRGDFGIRWYSLPYIFGFLLAHWRLSRAVERKELRNLTQENVDSFLIWLVVGVLLGARLFHVFVFSYDRYGFDPVEWIAVWRGGLSFHGGLLGAVLAATFFARRHGLRIYELTDRMALPAAVALGLGRIANFINAELYGTVWDGPFCVDYGQNPHLAQPPEGCRHPVQLYQSAKNWAIGGFLWAMTRGNRRRRPGEVTWAFIGLYGLIRFFLTYLRDQPPMWAGLQQAQIYSGIMAILGGVMYWTVVRGKGTDDGDPAAAAVAGGRRRKKGRR